MFNRELCTRVLQVAGSVMLCSYAVASQADPVSLQGVCHLSSLAGGPRCDLTYIVSDDFFAPGTARKSKVLVDGVIVGIYVNDIANPVENSIPTVTGTVTVACGQPHVVTAYVASLESSTSPYVKKGSLPSVACPALP
jgi:hypothetical protein